MPDRVWYNLFLSKYNTSNSLNLLVPKEFVTLILKSGEPGFGFSSSVLIYNWSNIISDNNLFLFVLSLVFPTNLKPLASKSGFGKVPLTLKISFVSIIISVSLFGSFIFDISKLSALYSNKVEAIASNIVVFPQPFSPTIVVSPEPKFMQSGILKFRIAKSSSSLNNL